MQDSNLRSASSAWDLQSQPFATRVNPACEVVLNTSSVLIKTPRYSPRGEEPFRLSRRSIRA